MFVDMPTTELQEIYIFSLLFFNKYYDILEEFEKTNSDGWTLGLNNGRNISALTAWDKK